MFSFSRWRSLLTNLFRMGWNHMLPLNVCIKLPGFLELDPVYRNSSFLLGYGFNIYGKRLIGWIPTVVVGKASCIWVLQGFNLAESIYFPRMDCRKKSSKNIGRTHKKYDGMPYPLWNALVCLNHLPSQVSRRKSPKLSFRRGDRVTAVNGDIFIRERWDSTWFYYQKIGI